MNVKYYTAFQRVVHWIEINPLYTIDMGVETLAVVFDIPGKQIREQLREALE